MSKFPRFLIAALLVVQCFSVASQDKSDYCGKISAEDEISAVTAAPKRTDIINKSEAASDGDTAKGAPARAGRSPMRRVSECGTAEVRTEFQHLIADSSGKFLPVFGTDFCEHAPATLASIGNGPVPAGAMACHDRVALRLLALSYFSRF